MLMFDMREMRKSHLEKTFWTIFNYLLDWCEMCMQDAPVLIEDIVGCKISKWVEEKDQEIKASWGRSGK